MANFRISDKSGDVPVLDIVTLAGSDPIQLNFDPLDGFAVATTLGVDEPKQLRLGNPILLASNSPVPEVHPEASTDQPKATDEEMLIKSFHSKDMQAKMAALLKKDPVVARAIFELNRFTMLSDQQVNPFFMYVVPYLMELGIIKDLKDLAGPVGKSLLKLAKLSGSGLSDIFHFSIRLLMKDKNVLDAASLKKELASDKGWLVDLATAAGKMNAEQRWKLLHFGMGTLLNAKVINAENLGEMFRYEEGYMLFEMANATHMIDAGRDYFGYIFADWLLEANVKTLDSRTIGAFIKDTSSAAAEFYAAGKRQRERSNGSDTPPMWRTVIRNFRGLLPMSDISKLLRLMAKVLDDPMDTGLAEYIEKEKNINVLNPIDVEDIRKAGAYGEFLEALTQKAGLKSQWLNEKVNLNALSERYRDERPEIIFDVASVINSYTQELGDQWIRDTVREVPYWEGKGLKIDVPVDVSSMLSVYSRYYIIKMVRPGDLKRYNFVLQDVKTEEMTVAKLATLMMYSEWLVQLVGQEKADKVINSIDIRNIKLDMRGIPNDVLDLKGLFAIRKYMNERSSTVVHEEGGRVMLGDLFIGNLSGMFANAIIVSKKDDIQDGSNNQVQINLMVKILFGWSDFDSIRYEMHSQDIIGNLKTMAGYIAAAVVGYFDNHQDEFMARKDKEAIRKKLIELEKPLWLDRPKDDLEQELMNFIKTN